jgi:hypothetical protein
MIFEEDIVINISDLGFSQIYLSSIKVKKIEKWFDKSLKNFKPIPVRDFNGNGRLTLTDGHTRTYIAWLNGIKELPAIYDRDEELVANNISSEMYLNCIMWCKRLKIDKISDFSDRILSGKDYKNLWNRRCERLLYLVQVLQNGTIKRKIFEEKETKLKEKDIYIYGISKDLKTIYCENNNGVLSEIKINEI